MTCNNLYSIFSRLALSLDHLFYQNYCKGDQVTKPIVKIGMLHTNYCSMSFKVTVVLSRMISKLLVTPAYLHTASDWPHTF